MWFRRFRVLELGDRESLVFRGYRARRLMIAVKCAGKTKTCTRHGPSSWWRLVVAAMFAATAFASATRQHQQQQNDVWW